MDSLDEDIDAETKERNRLQGEKNKTVAAAKRELDALRADQMELAGLEKDMEKYRGSGYDAQLEEHKNKVRYCKWDLLPRSLIRDETAFSLVFKIALPWST